MNDKQERTWKEVATDHFKEQSQGMPSRAVKGI
jgi:hypothetical protein